MSDVPDVPASLGVKPPRFFSFNIEVDETFDIADLWPDGDGPENPTLDDVVKLIQTCGGPDQVASDWNLLDGLSITISDNTGSRTIVGPGPGRVIGTYQQPCTECGGHPPIHKVSCSRLSPSVFIKPTRP
jgi:hypothetical protein